MSRKTVNMNCKRQKIVHVFEEKLCRFCAKSCGSKCYNIYENLLLYKQKQISFEEVINVVLGLTVITTNLIREFKVKQKLFLG